LIEFGVEIVQLLWSSLGE